MNWTSRLLLIGSASCVICILQLGCGPTRTDQLFTAVWNGDTNRVIRLVAAGADVNSVAKTLRQETPLIDAVRFGHLEVVRLLLARGADPNKVDRENHGALYHAFTSPYLLGGTAKNVAEEIVRILLAHGANPLGDGIAVATKAYPQSDTRAIEWQRAITNSKSGKR